MSAAADADSLDGTATITHTAAGGDYDGVTTSVAAVEQDKMGASTKVTVSLSPDEVGEGDGQTTVTVTGRLDGEALESPTTVTVSVGASGDGATAGTDYGTVAGFTFQILAGATEGSGTFNITPADDDIDEGNESVTVSGSVTGLSVDGGHAHDRRRRHARSACEPEPGGGPRGRDGDVHAGAGVGADGHGDGHSVADR